MQNHRLYLLVLAITILISIVSAATPTSFCKCTCGTESVIVALDAPPPTSRNHERLQLTRREEDDEEGDEDGDEPKAFQAKTCNDCNRQFCLDNNLLNCREVEEKAVFTQCFQRDSAKDQAIVYLFIALTVSLLGWAMVRPWIGTWMEKIREQRSYIPISGGGGEGSR